MKLADIEVGQFYAVGNPNYPAKAQVIEKGKFQKKVYSGVRWDRVLGGHMAEITGVKVKQFDWNGNEVITVETPQRVLRLWDIEEEKKKQEKELADERERLRLAVKRKVKEMGIPGAVDFNYSSYSNEKTGIRIVMTFDVAKNFIGEENV